MSRATASPWWARSAPFGVCAALSACNAYPSRTPLGGAYLDPPTQESADRRAPKPAPPAPSAAPDETEPAPTPAKPAPAAAAVVSDAGAPTPTADTLHYQPLKAGDRIKADVTLAFKAELRGGPPGLPASGSLGMDSKLCVEMKITKCPRKRWKSSS